MPLTVFGPGKLTPWRRAVAWVVASVALGGAVLTQDTAAETVAARGACFVRKFERNELARNPKLAISRIELQIVQPTSGDGKAFGSPAVEIGMQPKGGDDLIASALSAPCSGKGLALTCTIECNGRSMGRLQIAPDGNSRLRLVIEEALTLNGCQPGEKPFVLPTTVEHRAFTLRRASASDCFH